MSTSFPELTSAKSKTAFVKQCGPKMSFSEILSVWDPQWDILSDVTFAMCAGVHECKLFELATSALSAQVPGASIARTLHAGPLAQECILRTLRTRPGTEAGCCGWSPGDHQKAMFSSLASTCTDACESRIHTSQACESRVHF